MEILSLEEKEFLQSILNKKMSKKYVSQRLKIFQNNVDETTNKEEKPTFKE